MNNDSIILSFILKLSIIILKVGKKWEKISYRY